MKPFDGMIETFCAVDDPREMKRLFSELFTEAELQDLVLRWTLLEQLSEGVSQRDIAKNLGISLCKITRGAKILRDEKSYLYAIFKGDKKPLPRK